MKPNLRGTAWDPRTWEEGVLGRWAARKARSGWARLADRTRRDAVAAVTAARTRSERMLTEATTERRGSRKRALVPVVGGIVALAGMFQLVSSNVIAVNFTTANSEFKLYSNYLDAQQAAGFLAPTSKQNGSQQGVAELGIVTAKMAGMCAIASETIGILGTYSLKITAGQDVPDSYVGNAVPAGVDVNAAGQLQGTSLSGAISANNLFVNSDTLGGFGNKISGLNLGQSSNTVNTSAGLTWPTGQSAPANGNFGLYAQQLNVAGLTTDTFGINLAGAITLPGLKITVEPGAKTQTDCS